MQHGNCAPDCSVYLLIKSMRDLNRHRFIWALQTLWFSAPPFSLPKLVYPARIFEMMARKSIYVLRVVKAWSFVSSESQCLGVYALSLFVLWISSHKAPRSLYFPIQAGDDLHWYETGVGRTEVAFCSTRNDTLTVLWFFSPGRKPKYAVSSTVLLNGKTSCMYTSCVRI